MINTTGLLSFPVIKVSHTQTKMYENAHAQKGMIMEGTFLQ